nr:MFS transporter [Robbsia betulipollinis]
MFIDYLFYGMWVPLIPAYFPAARDSGQAGWVVSSYSAGILLFPLVFSLCRGRLTYWRVMFAAAILKCVALALLTAADDALLFAAGRVLQGVATAGTWSAAFAFLSSRHPGRGTAAIAGAGAVGAAGYALGPMLGAWAQEQFSAAAPPLIMACFLSIGVIFCGICKGRNDTTRSDPRPRERVVHKPAMRRGMPLALLVIATASASWSLIESLLPLRHGHRAAQSLQDVGTLFTVSSLIAIALTPAVVALVQRTSEHAAAGIGAALMSGALVVLAFSEEWGISLAALLSAQIAYQLMFYPMSAQVGQLACAMGNTSALSAYGLSNSVYSLGMLATGGAETLLGSRCDATQWMLIASAGIAVVGVGLFVSRRAGSDCGL